MDGGSSKGLQRLQRLQGPAGAVRHTAAFSPTFLRVPPPNVAPCGRHHWSIVPAAFELPHWGECQRRCGAAAVVMTLLLHFTVGVTCVLTVVSSVQPVPRLVAVTAG